MKLMYSLSSESNMWEGCCSEEWLSRTQGTYLNKVTHSLAWCTSVSGSQPHCFPPASPPATHTWHNTGWKVSFYHAQNPSLLIALSNVSFCCNLSSNSLTLLSAFLIYFNNYVFYFWNFSLVLFQTCRPLSPLQLLHFLWFLECVSSFVLSVSLMLAKDCSLYVLSVFTLRSSPAGIVLLMPWVGSTCLSRSFEYVFPKGLKTSKMHF